MDLTWAELAADELDVATLYDVLELRSQVFVVEQECAYLDVDGLDLLPGTRHLVARDGDGVAAYARVLAPDEEHAAPRIGRVIISGRARGRRLGRTLMERAIAAAERHWPGLGIDLEAQAHLRAFYAGLGFAAIGEEFVEDGIPHVWMRREARDLG